MSAQDLVTQTRMVSPDPLEDPHLARLCILPLTHRDVYAKYEIQRELFWVPSEVEGELNRDAQSWGKLPDGVRHLTLTILSFFAVSDGLVNANVSEEIVRRVQLPEAQTAYRYQGMMEDIHNIVYARLVETYVSDPTKRNEMFDAVKHFPTIRQKAEWVRRWIPTRSDTALPNECIAGIRTLLGVYDAGVATARTIRPGAIVPTSPAVECIRQLVADTIPRASLATVLLVNVLMEGVFFTASFAFIRYVYEHYEGALPGLSKVNEFISRDEGQHTEFGIMMYKLVRDRLPESVVHQIAQEAVNIESEFIQSALPTDLPNMNSTLMCDYIRYVADQLLVQLGYNKRWNTPRNSVVQMMLTQSMGNRIGDFFTDRNPTEYRLGAGKPQAPGLATRDDSDI